MVSQRKKALVRRRTSNRKPTVRKSVRWKSPWEKARSQREIEKNKEWTVMWGKMGRSAAEKRRVTRKILDEMRRLNGEDWRIYSRFVRYIKVARGLARDVNKKSEAQEFARGAHQGLIHSGLHVAGVHFLQDLITKEFFPQRSRR